jgi:hypothetical protein
MLYQLSCQIKEYKNDLDRLAKKLEQRRRVRFLNVETIIFPDVSRKAGVLSIIIMAGNKEFR